MFPKREKYGTYVIFFRHYPWAQNKNNPLAEEKEEERGRKSNKESLDLAARWMAAFGLQPERENAETQSTTDDGGNFILQFYFFKQKL